MQTQASILSESDTAALRRGRKYEQVLEGAREIFMAKGYEGAGVDDIARAAGVSKATLYSYFPDKKHLFLEVSRVECARQQAMAMAEIDMTAPPRVVLTHAAHYLLRFLLSDFGQQIFRIAVAEAARFPELGQAFYETGPQRGRGVLSEYLTDARARGQLKIDDISLAADQFSELCKADLFLKRVMGVICTPSEEEIARVAKGAVETFLARYGT